MIAGFRTHIVVVLVGILAVVGYRHLSRSRSASAAGTFYEDAPDWYNSSLEESELMERQEQSSCGPAQLYQSLFVEGSSISSGGIEHGDAVDSDTKVQIAVDVYLPCDYVPGSKQKYPLFFHMTRYGRRLSVRWPFSILMGTSINTRSKVYVSTFVPSGYVVVTMDVRGSGASGGSRTGDLLSNEVDDCVEVLRWAQQQPWFGGKVVSGGISYDGMLAATLAARGLLDVALLVFSPLNVYEELAVPGGVPCRGFVNPYSYFTTALETATTLVASDVGPLTFMTQLFFNGFIEGPAPPTMSGSLYGRNEIAAKTRSHVKEHSHNWNIRTVGENVQVKDDVAVRKAKSNGLKADYTAAQLGIDQAMIQQILDSQVKIMSYSGYYDSGAIRASATLFKAASALKQEGQVHVTVGPWTHGIRQSSSPFAEGRHMPGFLLGVDLLRFSDYALGRREKVAGISTSDEGNDAPLVRVFELQSHTWHATNTMNWASPTQANSQLDTAANNSDVKRSSMTEPAHHSFDDNAISTRTHRRRQMLTPNDKGKSTSVTRTLSSSNNATSLVGIMSRWNLIQQILMNPTYTNIRTKDIDLDNDYAKFTIDLTENEDEAESDRILFGMPMVRAQVRVRSSNSDNECGAEASLFFYLLLQDEFDHKKEELKYLTETQLRLGHRPLDSIDQRDFTQANFGRLSLNQYYDLEVGLEPVRFSWQPSRQKLVLLIGRHDSANFLVPHPICPDGQEAEMVDLLDVSVELPTVVA